MSGEKRIAIYKVLNSCKISPKVLVQNKLVKWKTESKVRWMRQQWFKPDICLKSVTDWQTDILSSREERQTVPGVTWGRGARYSGVMYLSPPSPLVITGPVSSSTVIAPPTCHARTRRTRHRGKRHAMSLVLVLVRWEAGLFSLSQFVTVWYILHAVKFPVWSSDHDWPGLYRRLY